MIFKLFLNLAQGDCMALFIRSRVASIAASLRHSRRRDFVSISQKCGQPSIRALWFIARVSYRWWRLPIKQIRETAQYHLSLHSSEVFLRVVGFNLKNWFAFLSVQRTGSYEIKRTDWRLWGRSCGVWCIIIFMFVNRCMLPLLRVSGIVVCESERQRHTRDLVLAQWAVDEPFPGICGVTRS